LAKILIAEDEEQIRLLIAEELVENGHEIREASDGKSGLDIARDFLPDLIISDVMMPGISGFDFYKLLRAENNQLQYVPVIFLTALADKNDLLDGKLLGVDDYLTKPIDFDLLNATVNARLNSVDRRMSYIADKLRKFYDQFNDPLISKDNPRYQSMDRFLENYLTQIEHFTNVIPGRDNLQATKYVFKTAEDVKKIAGGLSCLSADPEATALGLVELMMNAVEHGNLAIGYEVKTKFLKTNNYHNEIDRRLQLPEFKDKQATIEFERLSSGVIKFCICDQGQGFDWREFVDFSPNRLTDMHGRGIAMAGAVSFSSINYSGVGNIVNVTIE